MNKYRVIQITIIALSWCVFFFVLPCFMDDESQFFADFLVGFGITAPIVWALVFTLAWLDSKAKEDSNEH